MDIKTFGAKLRELLTLVEQPEIEVYADTEHGKGPRLFIPQQFSDAPEWIPYLPKPGRYQHAAYGAVEMSRERAERFIQNFRDKVYQEHIPIDAEHQTKASGALGYMRDMRLNEDGSADAKVEWTDRGRSLLASGGFKYFSPEITDVFTDAATGTQYRDVATGGALTTKPFFKDSSLRSLAASEENNTPQEDQMPDQKPDTKGETTDAPKPDAPTETKAEVIAPAQFNELSQKFAESEAARIRLTEEVATMRTDNRRKQFSEEIAGKSDANHIRWFGDEAKHLGVLETLTQTFGENSEQVKDYVQIQRDTAKRMSEAKIYSEIGGSGVSNGGPVADRMTGLIQTYREAHPDVSEAVAKAAVLEANPALVNEMRAGGSR